MAGRLKKLDKDCSAAKSTLTGAPQDCTYVIASTTVTTTLRPPSKSNQ